MIRKDRREGPEGEQRRQQEKKVGCIAVSVLFLSPPLLALYSYKEIGNGEGEGKARGRNECRTLREEHLLK